VTKQPMTVCYNGECPVCRHEIESYQRMAEAAGVDIQWRDITNDPTVLADRGITENDIARRLHVVADGKLLKGVEAFAALWAELPVMRRLAPALDWPVVRPLAHFIYERLLAPPLFAWHIRRRRRRAKS
jgi:predicted DCC family thiol-disulfide oxidoreductase YuxK